MSLEDQVHNTAQNIIEFMRAHEVWAAPIVGMMAFGESLVFIALELSTQARRALELLDAFQHGVAEEFLILSGFKREMLANLVLAGLITVVTETIQAGAPTIKAERYHITDDGRKALEG